MVKTGVNLQKLKEQNSFSILHVIREHGPVSRSQVGKILGLSNTTCMELARHLISRGLIREKGQGDSSGGRKPILLEINWEYNFVIGMILSQEGVSCGVYDLQINKKELVSHNVKLTGKEIVARIKECAFEAIHKSHLTEENIAGMTIGVGGIVDAAKANIMGSTHFQSREIIHIHDQLDSIFPFPLYLENYGNLMALAEKKLYYPQCESLVFIQVDTGIGGGIICNNKIIRGANGYAGEIGHMTIEKNGPMCFCGNKGCLEVMGSIPVLLQKASFGLLTQRDSLIRKFMDSDTVTIEAIVKAFQAHDRLAEQLFEEEAAILYHAALNIILTYDPEVIVLGGDIVLFGEAFLNRIQQSVQKTIFDVNSENRVIAFSRLTDQPRVCGAGIYAVESFFTDHVVYPDQTHIKHPHRIISPV
ncbi:MAG: ROK family transcriptional regulator [Treponema sp.]|jgi:predicted NBD/HSP70 family sugar kinase|nr:ROK family transcriptional regulator [Treponema sp.]